MKGGEGDIRIAEDRVSQAALWCVELKSGQMTELDFARYRAWIESNRRNIWDLAECEAIWEFTARLQEDTDLRGHIMGARAHRVESQAPVGRQRVALRGVAFAAAVMAIALLAWLLPAARLSDPHYSTGVGEQRTVLLADGSRIHMNTSTRLKVKFSDALRLIVLDYGEATFEVSHSVVRPFEVVAGPGVVRAVGTVFNVREDGPQVTVTVLEGVVQVKEDSISETAPKAQVPVITRHQQLSYNGSGLVSEIHPANVQRIESWHSGNLDFDGATLSEAVQEMNRYSNTKLIIGDEKLNRIRLSGIFKAGDTQSMVAGLVSAFPIRTISDRDRIILLPGG